MIHLVKLLFSLAGCLLLLALGIGFLIEADRLVQLRFAIAARAAEQASRPVVELLPKPRELATLKVTLGKDGVLRTPDGKAVPIFRFPGNGDKISLSEFINAIPSPPGQPPRFGPDIEQAWLRGEPGVFKLEYPAEVLKRAGK